MKKIISYTLNILLILLIGFLTIRLLFKDKGLGVFVHDFNQANKVWLGVGIVLVLLFVSSESVIIKYMLKMFGTKIPLLRCIKYSFVGFFVSYITPSASGGQPAQVYYMKKDGINVGHSTLIMVVIAFTYKLAIVVMGLAFILFRFDAMCRYMDGLAWLVVVGFLLNIAYIFLLLMLIIKPLWMRTVGIKAVGLLCKIKIIKNREKYVGKIERTCENYVECADYIKNNIKSVINIMIITIIQRTFLFAVTYVVYKSYDLQGTSFIDIIAIQTLIAIAVEMLPMPGAAGITEGCFLTMFALVFKDKLSSALLLSRGMSFYVLLILGAIVTAAAQIIVVRRDIKEKKAK